MKIKFILLIIFLILIIFSFIVPIKEVWLSDEVIYGDYFCYTPDNSCISTEGQYTQEKLTFYELIKYKGYYDNEN